MATAQVVAKAASERAEQLKITEIFHSIQGESSLAGWPTVFVRLTGCPLRCQYCDTAYAFGGGTWMSFADILQELQQYNCQHVCVTGGEPLGQARCIALLQQLCDAGYTVSLETSGAISVSEVDPRVIKVVDIKTPDSVEVHRNHWNNLDCLQDHDQIKFVICSHDDFLWAAEQVEQRQLSARWPVFFSPSYDQIKAADLAAWILQARLPVRMQLQLHKQIWGDEQGR